MGYIAIVDDSSLSRKKVIAALEGAFEYKAFGNPEEALEQIINDPPMCVVSDILMPKLTGDELLVKIKEKLPDIPVIFVSANFNEKKIEQLKSNGAECIIRKPFDPGELIGIVNELVGG